MSFKVRHKVASNAYMKEGKSAKGDMSILLPIHVVYKKDSS